jgi:membrane-anchored protein YejM (alkaline phosphatase superfamily)
VLAGLVEGRWWILVLAPVTWLVVWTPGLDDEASGYFLIFGVPVTFLGLLIGVAARASWRARKRTRARRALRPVDHP